MNEEAIHSRRPMRRDVYACDLARGYRGAESQDDGAEALSRVRAATSMRATTAAKGETTEAEYEDRYRKDDTACHKHIL